MLAKIIAYNLTVVIHEMYENGISPDFLHVSSGDSTPSKPAMIGSATGK